MMPEFIEREGAYPLAKKICDAIDSKEFQRLNFGMRILDWIDDIPAADVRPVVKSNWVDNRVAFYRGCPECGAFVRANLDEVFLRDFPSAVGKLNFCPNCGAWMEES